MKEPATEKLLRERIFFPKKMDTLILLVDH